MGHYQIPYHKSLLSLDIPDGNVHYYIDLKFPNTKKNNIQILTDAINRSESNSLHEFVNQKRVGLIIEDATRDVPLEDLLEASAPDLQMAQSVTVFIATGTHDGDNDGNHTIIDLVLRSQKKYSFALDNIIVNDCHSDSFYLAGITSGINNEICVHRESQNVDVFVVYSDMKNHYFAGYSNPIKNFIPGICNYSTAEKNHALALKDNATFGHHPLHPDPNRRDNPLAQDMWEAYHLICDGRPTYVLGTISKKKKILWSAAGLLEEVVDQGIREVDRMMSMEVLPTDKLIVSCGGYPNDESLYTAQRALELSKLGVKVGGEILFIAGCANGLGPKKSIKNFFEPLTEDISNILSKLNDKYIMYSHKTYKFAHLIDQMNKIFLLSEIPSELIQSIHLSPIKDPQSVIHQWTEENPQISIGIVSDGNKLALHEKKS
jgi:nickel-dependent lactate racemase